MEHKTWEGGGNVPAYKYKIISKTIIKHMHEVQIRRMKYFLTDIYLVFGMEKYPNNKYLIYERK